MRDWTNRRTNCGGLRQKFQKVKQDSWSKYLLGLQCWLSWSVSWLRIEHCSLLFSRESMGTRLNSFLNMSKVQWNPQMGQGIHLAQCPLWKNWREASDLAQENGRCWGAAVRRAFSANEQREKLRGEVKEPRDFYRQECQSLLQYKSPPVPQTFRKVLHNVPKWVFVFGGNHGKGCI